MHVPLHQLSVAVPPFFVEACGYRGDARYVALCWHEYDDELWLTDDGHALKGNEGTLAFLWRRPGGEAALERIRTEAATLGRTPWLVVDRDTHTLLLGTAADVWHLISSQCTRR